MVVGASKYAMIDGREAALLEEIIHASSGESVCVFEAEPGVRRFVTREEWDEATKSFLRYAAERRLVTSESPGREKVALFRSLFKGREDVYAHGFRKKDGGIGYAPVCVNDRAGHCPRRTWGARKVKCADCPVRDFVPVNNQAIVAHCRGEADDLRDVVGLYVLTPDCKTWVLVADFDKEGWQRETTLYRDACRAFGLCPAVERSRSGNGAHVWLFFDEPIDAELARSLGSALITHAMSLSPGMNFGSYDRLFPTQSTIPKGGFGNLIALPLQGRAQRNGNSVFVDERFEAFPDQWRFLSSVSKATPRQVQAIVDSAAGGPLGQLAFGNRLAGERGERIGGNRAVVSLRDVGSSPADFPKTVRVVKANMLCVSKQGLSHGAQNRIRRLAAFGNPEFYRAQAMHQSVFGKNRIIWCGEEDQSAIMLPRGCEQKLVELVQERGSACIFEDKRVDGPAVKVEFSGTLRIRQQKAVDALLRYQTGVLMAPTGFGKTVIGAYIVGKLKVPALIIVPKTSLVDQWRERLQRFLEIEDDRPPLLTKSGRPSKKKRPVIGQIGGGKNAPSGMVDIATFQSLSGKDDLGIPFAKPIVRNYGLVICDECHNGAAPNYELVMRSVRARYVFGLSATPKRSDGLERIVFMHCGPIRHRVDPKEQAIEQGFKRLLIPLFTRIRLASLEPGASFSQVAEGLCEHTARNALIAEDAASAVASGRNPLVITSRKEHADELARLLGESGVPVHVLTGEGTAKEKRERIEQVRSARDARFAIVATGAYIGEGFDLPRLDTLLLASPYSHEGVIAQYSGRLHRESEGKNDVIVYDYVDASIPMLERMYKKRLKAYAKLGYEVAEGGQACGPKASIVTWRLWRGQFCADLQRAGKSVVISVPYANPQLVESMLPDISSAIGRGVPVKVVVRKAGNERSAALQTAVVLTLSSTGCETMVCDGPLSGVAVFDGRIAWYGTLPLLAFAKADDCSLRVESAEVAADLERTLLGSLESCCGA